MLMLQALALALISFFMFGVTYTVMRSVLFEFFIHITTFIQFVVFVSITEYVSTKGSGSPAFLFARGQKVTPYGYAWTLFKESCRGFATRFERVVICGIVLFFELGVQSTVKSAQIGLWLAIWV